jgi:hypothetical protein
VDFVLTEWAWQVGYKKAKNAHDQSFKTFSEGKGLLSYWRFQLEKFGILAPGEIEIAHLHWRGKSHSNVFIEHIFYFKFSCC